MAMNKISPLKAKAANPPEQSIPKKTVSSRIGQHFAHSLESMAEALGKTPTGLATELLEAAIEEFAEEDLPKARPDLAGTYSAYDIANMGGRGHPEDPEEDDTWRKYKTPGEVLQTLQASLRQLPPPDEDEEPGGLELVIERADPVNQNGRRR